MKILHMLMLCVVSHKAQYLVHYYLFSTSMISVIFQTILGLNCLQMTQLLLVHAIILFCQANIELTKLYNWLCLNKLSLNIDKTSYILFSNKQDDPKNTINIDSINIKRVFSNKFLGVTIVHKFSWKTQIADVCKKVSRCTGILNKVKSILSTKIIIIIMAIFRCYFS